MHEAVGLRGVEFDHEAVGLHVGDRGLERTLVRAGGLAFEELEQLDLDRVALGFGAVALGDRDVLAGTRQLAQARRTQRFLRRGADALLLDEGVEDAVLQEVGVTADRRREVRVVALRQAEVAVRRRAVAGLLERPQQLDADGVAVLAVLEAGEQLDHLGTVGEVADLEAVAGELFAEGGELLGVGVVVDAVDVRDRSLVEGRGHALVGEEHELLDELVRFVVLHDLGAVGPAVLVAVDLDLLHLQVERPGAEAFGAEHLGDVPEVVDHALDQVQLGVGQLGERAARRAGLVRRRGGQGADLVLRQVLQERVGLLVGQALDAADDRVGELRPHQAGVRRELADHRLHQAVLGLDERAQSARQRVREHRDDRADEVGGIAAFAGLDVEGRTRLHVGGDVGDVDAHADVAVRHALHGQGVVEVLRVVRVDGDRRDRAEVLAAGAVGLGDDLAEGVGLGGDGGRELRAEAVAPQDGEVFGHRRMRDAEDFGDRAGRAEVAAFPRVEAHDDLVAGLRGGRQARAGRVAHDDLARDAGIVGDDEPLQAVVAERARELGERALDDAHDRARAPVVAVAVAAVGVELDQHAVAVERDVRVVGVDVQLLAGRRPGDGVEDDAGRTARTEEDGAFEELGLGLAGAALARGGQGEQVAFDGDDGAGLDEARDRLAEAAEVFARAAEGLHDGLQAHRLVAGPGEELQEDFFGAHALSFAPPSRLPR